MFITTQHMEDYFGVKQLWLNESELLRLEHKSPQLKPRLLSLLTDAKLNKNELHLSPPTIKFELKDQLLKDFLELKQDQIRFTLGDSGVGKKAGNDGLVMDEGLDQENNYG
jgi:hypothetical protein